MAALLNERSRLTLRVENCSNFGSSGCFTWLTVDSDSAEKELKIRDGAISPALFGTGSTPLVGSKVALKANICLVNFGRFRDSI